MSRMSLPQGAGSFPVLLQSYDQSWGTGAGPGAPSDQSFWFNDVQGGGHSFGPWTDGLRSRISAGGGNGARRSWPAWPIGQKASTAGITDALFPFRRRFTWELIAKAAAGSLADIGIKSESSTLAFSATNRGIVFTEAAGVWLLQRRSVSAGAIGTLVNTGLSTTTYRPIKFVFTEGLAPVLECWLGGALILKLVGEAAMPEVLTSAVQDYCIGIHMTGGAGNPVTSYGNKLTVEDVK